MKRLIEQKIYKGRKDPDPLFWYRVPPGGKKKTAPKLPKKPKTADETEAPF